MGELLPGLGRSDVAAMRDVTPHEQAPIAGQEDTVLLPGQLDQVVIAQVVVPESVEAQ